MVGRIPSVKFWQRIINPTRRQLVQRLTLEVWNTPDCEHFTEVLIKFLSPPWRRRTLTDQKSRNPLHTSHSDSRPHITLQMKTPRQIADKSSQTVHIYYDEQTGEYEAFKLYSERKDEL